MVIYQTVLSFLHFKSQSIWNNIKHRNPFKEAKRLVLMVNISNEWRFSTGRLPASLPTLERIRGSVVQCLDRWCQSKHVSVIDPNTTGTETRNQKGGHCILCLSACNVLVKPVKKISSVFISHVVCRTVEYTLTRSVKNGKAYTRLLCYTGLSRRQNWRTEPLREWWKLTVVSGKLR